MATSLIIDHKKMHDIKSAAAASGYSRDHVASLARAKKIVATQVARQWYVDLDSLTQYANVTHLEQQVRQKHLSEERRLQKELVEKINDQKNSRLASHASHSRNAKASVIAMASLVFLMIGSLGFYGDSMFPQLANQTASSKLASPTQPITVTGVQAVPDVAAETVFSNGQVEIVSMAEANEAIVLLPELASITASIFSDEVSVVETETGEQLLVPQGRAVEDGVPFTVLPITETDRL